MPFEIHTNAEKNFNKVAYDLVGLVEQRMIEPEESPRPLTGSYAERPSSDIGDRLFDAPFIMSNTKNKQEVDIYEGYNGFQIGFSDTNYVKFKKFIEQLNKSKPISNRVNSQFLHERVFAWVLQTYKNKRAETDIICYLREEIIKVTGSFKYYFKILNVDIAKNFKLGDVEFCYLKANFFDYMESTRPKEEVKAMNEKFQGCVYATLTLSEVERSRGSEIALEHCYMAMNVLKLYSKTVYFPEIRTTFDIDKRITIGESNECIIQNVNDAKDLKINFSASSLPYQLDETSIDGIVLLSKNFTNFISIEEPSELQRIVLNALEKFSEAISNSDLHKRIVDLFTIWESLLLKNDSVNIQDSLIFYGGHFLNIENDKKERFNSHIMRLYDVRSQVIHHANKKSFDIGALTELQTDTVSLMEIFIHHSGQGCDTKINLLESLDRHFKGSVEEYTNQRIK